MTQLKGGEAYEGEEIRQERQGQKVLTLAQQHTVHELARKVKGTYLQLVRLCRELDIPFPN